MTTKIFIILDRSGSMSSCWDDTIGGFNTFVEKQKNMKDDKAYISLYQFDHEYEVNYENRDIAKVEDLTKETFIPRGRTALLDAIGKTINNIPKKPENESYIVVIMTDGEENASINYSKTHINDLISNKKELGWEFIFIGANQDAIKEAATLGISVDSALNYDTKKTGAVFESLSAAIGRTRSTPMVNRMANKVHFTPKERNDSIAN